MINRDGAGLALVATVATTLALATALASGAGRAGAAARAAAPAGTIMTIAGGVGGPAKATTVALAALGVVSHGGSLYVADGPAVRRIAANDQLTTPAGSGAGAGEASMAFPDDVTVDSAAGHRMIMRSGRSGGRREPGGRSDQPGESATTTRSKSGAKSDGFPNSMVLLPAVSWSGTVIVPTVLKLPVGVNDTVCGAPPSTLTCACRPVAEPSR